MHPIILPTPLSPSDERALPAAAAGLFRHPAVILYRAEDAPNAVRVCAQGCAARSRRLLDAAAEVDHPAFAHVLQMAALAEIERGAAVLAEGGR
jgi:hypothetical protein